jgi:mRNA-degrading endonuclease RelE of RelBE toxin-antitoxin system
MNYSVIPSPTFKRNIKKLKKRYPAIVEDIRRYSTGLQVGNFSGIIVKQLNGEIYKDRIKNTSLQKGKSGGFRIVYYATIVEKEVYLLSIYSKTDKANIDIVAIQKAMQEMGF